MDRRHPDGVAEAAAPLQRHGAAVGADPVAADAFEVQGRRRPRVEGPIGACRAGHGLDAATGAHVWKHETHEAIWGSVLLAGDRLYVGNVEGTMTVLRAGRRKELLGTIEMDAPIYSAPALVGDALYLATANRLYLIAAKPPS